MPAFIRNAAKCCRNSANGSFRRPGCTRPDVAERTLRIFRVFGVVFPFALPSVDFLAAIRLISHHDDRNGQQQFLSKNPEIDGCKNAARRRRFLVSDAPQGGGDLRHAVLANTSTDNCVHPGSRTRDGVTGDTGAGDRVAANAGSDDRALADTRADDRIAANSGTSNRIPSNACSGDGVRPNTRTDNRLTADPRARNRSGGNRAVASVSRAGNDSASGLNTLSVVAREPNLCTCKAGTGNKRFSNGQARNTHLRHSQSTASTQVRQFGET